MRIGIDGAGVVGLRTARELMGTDGVDIVAVRSDRTDRVDLMRSLLGDRVRALLPDEATEVMVLCGPAGSTASAAAVAIRAGSDVIAVTDDIEDIVALRRLDGEARSLGRTVHVGATASPGMSCVLVRHAADALDEVLEIEVAMVGGGGPGCLRQRQRMMSDHGSEWRDNDWVTYPGGSGRQQAWFPEPIGPRDVTRGNTAEPMLLHEAFPNARRITAKLAIEPATRVLGFLPRRRGVAAPEGGPGSVRVEVYGTLDGVPKNFVYAVLDRPAVISAALVASLVTLRDEWRPGANGLTSWMNTTGLLRELARRGVKAATPETPDEADQSQVS